jgi:hypothetical protein
MIRSYRPVLTGAMPKVTAVATAAPVRAAEVRNVPWKVAVAAEAASTEGQASRGSERNAPGLAISVMTASTSPPDRIRAPPTATGPAWECAMISAGPTVPHSSPAASPTRIAERLFRRLGRMLRKSTALYVYSRISDRFLIAGPIIVRP